MVDFCNMHIGFCLILSIPSKYPLFFPFFTPSIDTPPFYTDNHVPIGV